MLYSYEVDVEIEGGEDVCSRREGVVCTSEHNLDSSPAILLDRGGSSEGEHGHTV